MFKIKVLCYDVGNVDPTEVEPIRNNKFRNKEDAYEKMIQLAEDECEVLNTDLELEFDGQVSFGVADFDDAVHVYYYYMDSPNDTTGNTEIVTTYYIEKE